MDYITTTELRTKTKQLLLALKSGKSVKLLHRSKVLGEISPDKNAETPKPFDVKAFRKALEGFDLEQTTEQEREHRYRKHLEEKYG